ncbi:hypothetical protein ACFX2A_013702 [Malus domestica]
MENKENPKGYLEDYFSAAWISHDHTFALGCHSLDTDLSDYFTNGSLKSKGRRSQSLFQQTQSQTAYQRDDLHNPPCRNWLATKRAKPRVQPSHYSITCTPRAD